MQIFYVEGTSIFYLISETINGIFEGLEDLRNLFYSPRKHRIDYPLINYVVLYVLFTLSK